MLHTGDCRDVMATMDADSVDAIVTDPPYGLSFLGKGWDHGVPGVEFWTEALRVLKPGGHLLAFGGTRTYHRLAVSIEDAGFEIRDCLSWLYGSGFPKSHNLKDDWQGWGTALKPGWEPIIMARKPFRGTVAANVLEWGTGAINIDATRVGVGDVIRGGGNGQASHGGRFGSGETHGTRPIVQSHDKGRWPANVVLDEAIAEQHDWSRYFYTAKASKAERNAGLDGMPERQVTTADKWATNDRRSGTARQPEEWKQSPVANHHPTVKPVALMRWLVQLVTPPGGVVLDPFTGSGTTGVAAVAEGFQFVGIEREPEYVEIAQRRIAYAETQARQMEMEAA